jgi:hypothetical protein
LRSSTRRSRARLLGKEPRATVEAVRMGRKYMFASSAKAERELGFKVLPIYNAMRAAIEWFGARVCASVAETDAVRAAMKRGHHRRAAARGERAGEGLGSGGDARAAWLSTPMARRWLRAPGWERHARSLAVHAAMDAMPMTALLSVGLAGACDPKLRVGEIVRAGVVIDARTGETFEDDALQAGVGGHDGCDCECAREGAAAGNLHRRRNGGHGGGGSGATGADARASPSHAIKAISDERILRWRPARPQPLPRLREDSCAMTRFLIYLAVAA